jgi:hypothetical protein
VRLEPWARQDLQDTAQPEPLVWDPLERLEPWARQVLQDTAQLEPLERWVRQVLPVKV